MSFSALLAARSTKFLLAAVKVGAGKVTFIRFISKNYIYMPEVLARPQTALCQRNI